MENTALFELLATRRSIRRFTDQRPSRALIERIVTAATWAPSNHNRQGWRFIVFDDERAIRHLAVRAEQAIAQLMAAAHPLVAEHSEELAGAGSAFGHAPTVILAMHKSRRVLTDSALDQALSRLVSFEAVSTAMAVENLLLAAHACDLGACVMTAPLLAIDIWESLPDLPPGFTPTCIVAVGYPAEQPEMPRRKALHHVIEYR